MFLKIKDIPNNTQICNEFQLNEASVYLMKQKKNNRFNMYSTAWLYRLILKYSNNRIQRYIPSNTELADFTGTTKANISLLKNKQGRLFDVYIDSYNLERLFRILKDC